MQQQQASRFGPVLDLLELSGAACTYAQVSRFVEPGIRIKSLDMQLDVIVRPFKQRILESRLGAVREGAVIVPAANLALEHPQWTSTTDEILATVNRDLGLRGPVQMRLKHYAMDPCGTAASVASDSPDAIGRVIVMLPSIYDGGYMQVWRQRFASASSEVYGSGYYATYSTAEITINRITSGGRGVLVYDLVYAGRDVGVVHAPNKLAYAASTLEAMALEPSAVEITYFALDLPRSPLHVDSLSYAERRFLDALITSSSYDIVLVEVHDGQTVIVRSQAVPFVEVPNLVVQTGIIGKHIYGDVINMASILFEPTKFIAFWPKRTRVWIVGIDIALASLCLAIGERAPLCPTDDRLLGTSSVRELALAVLPHFLGLSGRAASSGAAPPPPLPAHTPYLQIFHGVLVTLGDVTVTSCFIAKFLDITTPFATVAQLLHTTLVAFGWEPLVLAMTSMLTRWRMRTWDASFSYGFRLVASLAGVTNDPVCPRLDLPFVSEFIKLCWAAVAKYLPAPGDIGLISDARVLIESTFLLEAYFKSSDGWLTDKLPAGLCIEIDSYLLPTSTIEQYIDFWMQREPLHIVVRALATATKRNPQLPVNPYRPAITNALTNISVQTICTGWDLASGLALAVQPLPETLLLDLWTKFGSFLLPVLVAALAKHGLSPGASLSHVFMHAAQAFDLPRCQHRVLVYHYGASPPLRGPVPTCNSTRLVLDALEYFRLYDAEKRSTFVDAFLAATASKPEANTVFRNFELRESASDVCLAKAGLERFPSALGGWKQYILVKCMAVFQTPEASDATMRQQFQRLVERSSPSSA